MKEKKSTRKSHVGKAFDDDDDIVLDVDLSMFPISVPKASVPSKETETKVAAPPLQHKAKPLKEKIVDTIAKEIKASTSKVTKPGKHVVVHLPRMRFYDCGDASFRFLMELEKTTGAPWEIYREPPLIFRVKPYSADSELSPSLERYNEAYGTNLRQELIAVHVPGSGEDDNRYNLPLLWGAKDGMRGVDRAAKEVFKMSEGVVGEVGGQGEREEGEVIPTRGLGKSTVPFEVDYEDKSFNPEKYEKSVRRFEQKDLARMSATIGYKVFCSTLAICFLSLFFYESFHFGVLILQSIILGKMLWRRLRLRKRAC
nr:uncharacterized protein LOC117833960 [Setaria viridis]XP_034569566.1 uncharacterized protein LOC117834058 [Setaria viridis]XP_034606279.1 uncharacterized protein LOC117866233 [Setaria viridis]XP_034606474.1 uncharacterized protein LOC117866388 [Setaria viridis]